MGRPRVLLFVPLAVVIGIAIFFAGGISRTSAEPPVIEKARVEATLGSAFTYQGQLKQGGTAVNGNCDFQFGIFLDSTGGFAGGTLTVAQWV